MKACNTWPTMLYLLPVVCLFYTNLISHAVYAGLEFNKTQLRVDLDNVVEPTGITCTDPAAQVWELSQRFSNVCLALHVELLVCTAQITDQLHLNL